MKKRIFRFTLFAALFINDCCGQNTRPSDPPLPLEKFKKLAFEPPAPGVLAALKVPFLDGDKYGIADAEGNILLAPQFEDAEIMAHDLPFFKAKKGGKWSVFDLDGRRILPVSTETAWELALDWERIGSRFDENGLHIEQLMTKIKDPRPAVFTDPSGATTTASRYFFLKDKTRQPYRSWFAPDHLFFIRSTRDRWMMSGFTSTFHHGNLKIMDENGRFGLLDCDGNLLQPPVRNCASIGSAHKILLLGDGNNVALRDAKKGWQTDFLFNSIEPTPDPEVFFGEYLEEGRPTRLFQIDSAGGVTPIEGMTKMEWFEKARKSTQKPDLLHILQEGKDGVLIDPRDGHEIFRIADGRISRIDRGCFVVEKDKKYGLVDPYGKQLLPIEFDNLISNWLDMTVIAIKNDLCGYFDLATGREILPVEWPYLTRGVLTTGRGVGVTIRSGKDLVRLTKNLEVVHQQGPNKPVKRSDFRLSENTPAAAVADFETAEVPEFITSLIPMQGPRWLHIFRSDGPHVVSIEIGPAEVRQVFFNLHEHYLDTSNECFSGFVKVRPSGGGKSFYVRLMDGKAFKK